jgi:hypothetical protein
MIAMIAMITMIIMIMRTTVRVDLFKKIDYEMSSVVGNGNLLLTIRNVARKVSST